MSETSVKQAYFRTLFFDKRAPMMQAWADFLDRVEDATGRNIVAALRA